LVELRDLKHYANRYRGDTNRRSSRGRLTRPRDKTLLAPNASLKTPISTRVAPDVPNCTLTRRPVHFGR
jgi:hypothetical protein